MHTRYFKKYWDEEQIWFYIHFEDDWAVRQIEVSPTGTTYATWEHAKNGGQRICDQPLSQMEIDGDEFISAEEFEAVWAGKDASA